MCPTERQLLRLVTDPAADPDATAHLHACGPCRHRLAEMNALWNVLDQWQPVPADRDLSGAIVAAAIAESRSSRLWQLRAAASVLLAIGTGVAVAAAVPVRTEPQSPEPATPEGVASALGLDFLGGHPAGLADALANPGDPT